MVMSPRIRGPVLGDDPPSIPLSKNTPSKLTDKPSGLTDKPSGLTDKPSKLTDPGLAFFLVKLGRFDLTNGTDWPPKGSNLGFGKWDPENFRGNRLVGDFFRNHAGPDSLEVLDP